MNNTDHNKLFEHLESKGVEEVRLDLAQGRYGEKKQRLWKIS